MEQKTRLQTHKPLQIFVFTGILLLSLVARPELNDSIAPTYVLSNAGQNLQHQFLDGEWAVGEMAADSALSSENYILTQGFCQGYIDGSHIPTVVDNTEDPNLITVFPIPAYDQINFYYSGVEVAEESAHTFEISVYTQLGAQILKRRVSGRYGYGQIDISELKTSDYYLKVVDTKSGIELGVTKFVKIAR